MRLTAIIATDLAGGVGHKGGLPWPRLARDMRRFRDATMGKVCIVGRKTYETLPPLKGRQLLILTRTMAGLPDDNDNVFGLAMNLDVALSWAREQMKAPEVVVIGGADVYRQALPLCDRMLLTVVHGTYEADTHLATPAVLCEGWVRLSSETHDPDESNPVRVTFSEWVRP